MMCKMTRLRRLLQKLGVLASKTDDMKKTASRRGTTQKPKQRSEVGRTQATSPASSERSERATPSARPAASRRIRLIAGMDVGTAFSKVVVQVARRHLAVPFGEAAANEHSRFLVPTALSCMDAEGRCLLGSRKGATRKVTDIKMPLIDRERSFTDDDRMHLTTFMALLLREVWRWGEAEVHRTLGSRRIDWAVNLGVPTESCEEELVADYRRCATAAWRLAELARSRSLDYLTLAECREVLESTARADAATFKVFPEFVAQVSSYVQTPLRKEGVHVMVDAGGGTLDVTVFMVLPWQDEGEPVFPVFARRVGRLGTRFLVRCRWERTKPDRCPEPSPFRNLPSEAETAGLLGLTLEQLRGVDRPFYEAVVSCIGQTVKRAACKGGLRWPGRLFLVGGGASVELYQRAFREYESKEWEYKLDGIELPRPPNLLMPRSGGMKWHRLAVAYGLSFDPDDIGRIRPPDCIEKVDPIIRKPPPVPPPWSRSRS